MGDGLGGAAGAGPVQTLLGGRVLLRQPEKGLGAGLDAVMLAAAVTDRPGGMLLDAGCGAGAVFLCVLARCPGMRAVAIERDPGLASLARENAALNGWAGRVEVLEGDIADPAIARRLPRCDAAVSNPPYWPGGTAPPAALRAGATHAGEVALEAWVRLLAGALGRGSRATLVLPAARLHEGIGALVQAGLGGVEIYPLWPRAGRVAGRVLLRARRAPRAPASVHPGLVLHAEAGWTAEADAVLRGAALPWAEA